MVVQEILRKLAADNTTEPQPRHYSNTVYIQAPEVIECPTPVYTQKARDAGIEGTIVLKAEIDKEGKVNAVVLAQGLEYDLDDATMRTVMGRRFKPAIRNGQPIEYMSIVEITFAII